LKAFTVVIVLYKSFWVITRCHSLAGNQCFGTNICPFFRVIHETNDHHSSHGSLDHPEEGIDISPKTLVSYQRMTLGNNPKTFIKNSEALWCNHCCHGNAMFLTYSEHVSVALVIQGFKSHALYYMVLWPSASTIFFHIV
jgi:hypothetical protein